MARLRIAWVVLCVILAARAFGAMVAGSEPKDWPANPERHTISVTREADDEEGRKMIAAAEAALPETGTWWVEKDGQPVLTLGLKTLCAITKGALEYYEAKIREYQKKDWRWYTEPSSSLVYKAAVKHEEKYSVNGTDFADVYVVKMDLTLSFSHVEDPSAGVTMHKTRTVVLDRNSVPQVIDGDGDETFPVWMM